MKLLDSLKMRWLVWVWNHTPNCAEMSRLASRSLDQPLSLELRCRMWLHHLICVWCKRYGKQVRFLHHAVHEQPYRGNESPPSGLSLEARERCKRALRDAMK